MYGVECHAHAEQLERIGEKYGDGAWWGSAERSETTTGSHTPDMAPAENRRRFVSCARVGISSCERVS